jgi:putative iron-only hydrogenase system regulator
MSQQRLGFLGIIVEDRKKSADAVNHILTDYGDQIIARMGIPHREKDRSIITLIIDMTTDQLGALTGKLGSVEGITVKSALSKLT